MKTKKYILWFLLYVITALLCASCTASKPVTHVYKPIHVNTGAGDSLIGFQVYKVYYPYHVRFK